MHSVYYTTHLLK